MGLSKQFTVFFVNLDADKLPYNKTNTTIVIYANLLLMVSEVIVSTVCITPLIILQRYS